MWKLLPIIFLLSTPMARADLSHKLSTSTQLTVNAGITQTKRIGSSFSVSGTGVDTTDGTTANTVSVGTITSGVYAPGTIAATQDVPGASFAFSQNYTQADAVPTSAPAVGAVANFSDVTSHAAGTAGSLAGTITSQGVMTLTAGGAGSTATGQFVSEISLN